MKPHLEALDIAQGQGEEVKEKGPFGLCSQRYELSLLLGFCLLEYILEICRLSAETGPIIDYLAVNLAGGIIYERHGAVFLSEKVIDILITDLRKGRLLQPALEFFLLSFLGNLIKYLRETL